jgi:hypothetical protein
VVIGRNVMDVWLWTKSLPARVILDAMRKMDLEMTVYILRPPGESASQQNMIWIVLVSAFLVLQPAKAFVDCGVSGVYRRPNVIPFLTPLRSRFAAQ